MIVATAKSSSLDAAAEQVKTALGTAKPVGIFVFYSRKHPYANPGRALRQMFPGTPVLGATSGGCQFSNTAFSQEEIVLGAIGSEDDVVSESFCIEHIEERAESKIERTLGGMLDKVGRYANEGFGKYTLLLLEDAYTVDGDTLVKAVGRYGGLHALMAGGLAGDDLEFKGTTSLVYNEATPEKAFAGLALFSRKSVGIGVRHGWSPFTDYHKVTRSEANVVSEIDGRPAFDVLAEELERIGEPVDRSNPVASVVNCGLGLHNIEDELMVRSALGMQGSSLVYAGQVPQGRNVRFVRTDGAGLIRGAADSIREAVADLDGPPGGAIAFSCGGRYLALGADYGKELEAISAGIPGAPFFGFATYGEIGRRSGHAVGFHNTTLVTAAFSRA